MKEENNNQRNEITPDMFDKIAKGILMERHGLFKRLAEHSSDEREQRFTNEMVDMLSNAIIKDKSELLRKLYQLDSVPYDFSEYHPTTSIKNNDNGGYTATMYEFGIVCDSETKEGAIKLLANELVRYANAYIENVQYYFNDENRKSEFPYVLNVCMQTDLDNVIEMIQSGGFSDE